MSEATSVRQPAVPRTLIVSLGIIRLQRSIIIYHNERESLKMLCLVQNSLFKMLGKSTM